MATGQALVARGHEIHVLSCVRDQESRDYVDQGIHVHRRGQIKIRLFNRFMRVLRMRFSAERVRVGISAFHEYKKLGVDFDVIEYPDWGAEGWLIALLHPAPLVCELHAPLSVICRYNQIPVNHDAKIASFFERFSAHRANVVSSPSQLLVEELKAMGWLKRDDTRIVRLSTNWSQWEAAQPTASTGPVILFLGRLQHIKAPEVLVEALALVKKRIPEAQALFVGGSNKRDGRPYHEWIQRNYQDISGCQFIGYARRQDVIRYVSECRVMAITSIFDNFNLAALEAIAAGRPIVVSDRVGIAEISRGTSGCTVVRAGDPKSLAEALIPYLADAAHAAGAGETTRAAFRAVLGADRIAGERERIYLDAIEDYEKRKGKAA